MSASSGNWRYAGLVREIRDGKMIMEVKHKITKGMRLEVLLPSQLQPLEITVDDFYDERTGDLIGEMSSGHLGQAVIIPLPSQSAEYVKPLCVVRTKIA